MCDELGGERQDQAARELSARIRPSAPSILREHVGAWFEEDDDVPFMMQVFQIREAKPGSARRFRR